jgi:IS1 family transposase
MNCIYCGNPCKKAGKQKKTGIQRHQCRHCKKYQQSDYNRPRIPEYLYHWTHILSNEGCGVSSISRVLSIARSSVQRLKERLEKQLELPRFTKKGCSYELDEMKTYCGKKKNESWLIYAIEKNTRRIVSFTVGRRTRENIKKVVDEVMSLSPKHIYTDRLNMYATLIPNKLHKYYPKCTNHIERMNLTLRLRLKRFQRKGICFTRSERMMYNSVYLWVAA